MAEEGEIAKNPDLELPQLLYILNLPDQLCPNKAETKAKLISAIKQNAMLPYYKYVCEQQKWEEDKALVDELKSANEAKLKELNAKIDDAIANLGESEIREGLLAKADYFCKIGDKEQAESAYRATVEKTVALGQKLDIFFSLIRIGFFYNDHDLIIRNMEKAKSMVEQGGDWDRRNRLKVYDALYCMSVRKYETAAKLYLETLSTFTSYEIFDYKTFILYTVLMSLISLDRVLLRQKVIDSPEILSVIRDIPDLSDLLNSFYNCNYRIFFRALANIIDQLKLDRYLGAHARFLCREMRVLAYSQLLESYRSVQLSSMAEAFGVSIEFLDKELSRFISTGRLHCKIDKVGGVVETNRSDGKNAQYQVTIKQGDLLLNRIQKLARVI